MSHGSSLYAQSACFWRGTSPANDVDAYTSTPIDLDGAVVGDEIWSGAADQLYMTSPASVTLTQTEAGGATVVYTVVGENQFGDPVSEDVSITGSTDGDTLHCYRKIATITIKSVSGGPLGTGDNLDVGHITSGGGFRLPTLCRSPSAGQVEAVIWEAVTAASGAPASVDSARHCVAITNGYSVGGAYAMLLNKDYDERS